MDQKRKIWAIAGVLHIDQETPRSSEGTSRRGEAEREAGQASGSPSKGLCRSKAVLHHGEATIHGMEMLCFCFILFFCCSEDLSI